MLDIVVFFNIPVFHHMKLNLKKIRTLYSLNYNWIQALNLPLLDDLRSKQWWFSWRLYKEDEKKKLISSFRGSNKLGRERWTVTFRGDQTPGRAGRQKSVHLCGPGQSAGQKVLAQTRTLRAFAGLCNILFIYIM